MATFQRVNEMCIQTFTNSNLVLRDGAAVQRGSDHAPESAVAGPVQTVNAAAALVLLLSAHRAAAADPQHHRARAVLGLLAFGFITGQANERPTVFRDQHHKLENQHAFHKKIHPGGGHEGKVKKKKIY